MSNTINKITNFIKKNLYYFIFLVSLAVLTVVTVIVVVNNEKTDADVNISSNLNTDGGNEQENENPGEEQQPEQPVDAVIIFDMPINNATLIKDYVDNGVIYNQTLGVYSGHKAMDFSASDGEKVYCCYDGVVESVVESKIEGVTLTVDHGNGLKTEYNSIDVLEDITVGKSLKRGDVIGEVSSNNRTEYKDGAHLHFTVLENGEKVDPKKYLLTEDK